MSLKLRDRSRRVANPKWKQQNLPKQQKHLVQPRIVRLQRTVVALTERRAPKVNTLKGATYSRTTVLNRTLDAAQMELQMVA